SLREVRALELKRTCDGHSPRGSSREAEVARRSYEGRSTLGALRGPSAKRRVGLAHVAVANQAIDVVPRFDDGPEHGRVFVTVGAVGLRHVPVRVVAVDGVTIAAAQPELGAVGPDPGALVGAVAGADPDAVGIAHREAGFADESILLGVV